MNKGIKLPENQGCRVNSDFLVGCSKVLTNIIIMLDTSSLLGSNYIHRTFKQVRISLHVKISRKVCISRNVRINWKIDNENMDQSLTTTCLIRHLRSTVYKTNMMSYAPSDLTAIGNIHFSEVQICWDQLYCRKRLHQKKVCRLTEIFRLIPS